MFQISGVNNQPPVTREQQPTSDDATGYYGDDDNYDYDDGDNASDNEFESEVNEEEDDDESEELCVGNYRQRVENVGNVEGREIAGDKSSGGADVVMKSGGELVPPCGANGITAEESEGLSGEEGDEVGNGGDGINNGEFTCEQRESMNKEKFESVGEGSEEGGSRGGGASEVRGEEGENGPTGASKPKNLRRRKVGPRKDR